MNTDTLLTDPHDTPESAPSWTPAGIPDHLPITTHQALFDAVVGHLLKQGGPARDAEICRYRTAEGRACGIGGLISDARYDPSLENCPAERYEVMNAARIDPRLAHETLTLQRLHDQYAPAGVTDAEFLDEFSVDAYAYAKRHNLDTRVISVWEAGRARG